jgi:hypothetical protein
MACLVVALDINSRDKPQVMILRCERLKQYSNKIGKKYSIHLLRPGPLSSPLSLSTKFHPPFATLGTVC